MMPGRETRISEAESDMWSELTGAAFEGDVLAVRRLLVAGADPNATDDDGVAPLVCAAHGGMACFDELLAGGARCDPGILARCLNFACHASETAMVERLLGLGADVQAEACGQTALHAAVEGRDVAVVDRILAAGGRVDSHDRRGRTPLHLAAVIREVPLLQRLVEAGADLHAVDLDGATALDLVARREALVDPQGMPVGQDELETAAWLRRAMAARRSL